MTAIVLLTASTLGWDLGLPTFIAGAAVTTFVLAIGRQSPLPVLKDISWSVLPLVGIATAASVIAWLADAHALLTLYASTPFGRSGSSETSRAMFGASTEGTTVPNTSDWTSFPSRFVRCSSSATHNLPRSMAEIDLNAVPAFAKGVRTPATMATRRPFPNVAIKGT